MSAVANETLAFWGQFDALEPSASLGGIYAPKGGYHDTRVGAGGGDYSVAEVSDDRQGPSDKASAIDLTMSDTAMRKYSKRMDDACKARDPRLFIGGRPVIREFIGTLDSRSVYCYVLTGGRARGLPADSSPDYNRDSSHLWHMHISIIRRFLAVKRAYDGLYSILRGESLADWNARENPAPASSEKEDDMPQWTALTIPAGFAYDADGAATDRSKAVSVPLPPAGLGAYAGKSLFASFSTDHVPPATPVKLRVAVNNGAWNVKTVELVPGIRINLGVAATTNAQAYAVTIGRIASDVPEHADAPVGVLFEIV